MRANTLWWSLAAALGLGMLTAGCGGDGSDDAAGGSVESGAEFAGEASGPALAPVAPAGQAPAEAPAGAMPAAPPAGAGGAAMAAGPAGARNPSPDQPANANPGQGLGSGDSATDQMLALGSGDGAAAPPGQAGPAGDPGADAEPAGGPGRRGMFAPPDSSGGGTSGAGAPDSSAGGGQAGMTVGMRERAAGFSGSSAGSGGGAQADMVIGPGAGYPGADGSSGMSGEMAARMRQGQGQGMPGYPGRSGGPGGPASGRVGGEEGAGGPLGGMAGAGGPGGGKDDEPDYSNPVKGAETFLNAVKNKDTRLLAEAVAIRAQYEAFRPRDQDMFKAIKEESVDTETLDDLTRAFDDMKVMLRNLPKSTGSVGVIVGRQQDNQIQMRTLTMRREKAGWKVQDISGLRVEKMPNYGNANKKGDAGGDGKDY